MILNVCYMKEDLDGVQKEFKTIPKHYSSVSSKLTLVRDSYDLFCEPVRMIDSNDLYDCDNDILMLCVNYAMRDKVFSAMLHSSKLPYWEYSV